MREPDCGEPGSAYAWRVPLERVNEWVAEHPELMHAASRDGLFTAVWRDLWYMHVWVTGGIYDDQIARREWYAVILRDLRQAPDTYTRMYREAEWDLVVERIANHEPPVNGDGLHDQTDLPPALHYQFHGLPDQTVLNVDGQGTTFAIYAIDILKYGKRPAGPVIAWLSILVNMLRERNGCEPLRIADGRGSGEPYAGLLCTLEDGAPVTLPGRAPTGNASV